MSLDLEMASTSDYQNQCLADYPTSSEEMKDDDPNRPLNLLDLPVENLENVFKFLSFETIGKVRMVCSAFNSVGSNMLNKEFNHLRNHMQQNFQKIKQQMPRRESARRKHPLARESDIIETLYMRLTLLQMTLGKHIERKHCCFFAGDILDEVYRILHYVKNTPNPSRAYKVTDELFDLSSMAMEYFKEHIEPTLPEITYFAADFMDYTPTFSGSAKTQLSLMDSPSTSSTRSTCVTPTSPVDPASAVNPVVKKRLRKLRETMKRSNGQVQAMKRELAATRRRMGGQQKEIYKLKSRFEEYDKKFQNTSRKLNAVLQELSKCKTELQYWRSKSPAVYCSCGKATPVLKIQEIDEGTSSDIIDEPLEGICNFSDTENFTEEEFKPIASPTEIADPESPQLVVVPACHSDCLPVLKGRVTDSELSTKDVVEKPVGSVAGTSCKRKLEMDDLETDIPKKKVLQCSST